MEGVSFGIVCSIMKTLWAISRNRSSLTPKTQFIGTTEHAASGICRGKSILLNFVKKLCRFEEALFDFDRALSLEVTNPIIYSNRGLVNRKLENYD